MHIDSQKMGKLQGGGEKIRTRLLAGIGNRAQAQAAEGVVLLLPDLF